MREGIRVQDSWGKVDAGVVPDDVTRSSRLAGNAPVAGCQDDGWTPEYVEWLGGKWELVRVSGFG